MVIVYLFHAEQISNTYMISTSRTTLFVYLFVCFLTSVVITVYMYILRASWKISYYMYTPIYVCAKCCHPHKIKSLLTYLLTRGWRDFFFLNLQQMTIMMRPSCWHKNFGPNGLSAPAQGLCLNFFSSIAAEFNMSSALRWAIQDQWSSVRAWD